MDKHKVNVIKRGDEYIAATEAIYKYAKSYHRKKQKKALAIIGELVNLLNIQESRVNGKFKVSDESFMNNYWYPIKNTAINYLLNKERNGH